MQQAHAVRAFSRFDGEKNDQQHFTSNFGRLWKPEFEIGKTSFGSKCLIPMPTGAHEVPFQWKCGLEMNFTSATRLIDQTFE